MEVFGGIITLQMQITYLKHLMFHGVCRTGYCEVLSRSPPLLRSVVGGETVSGDILVVTTRGGHVLLASRTAVKHPIIHRASSL